MPSSPRRCLCVLLGAALATAPAAAALPRTVAYLQICGAGGRIPVNLPPDPEQRPEWMPACHASAAANTGRKR